MPTPSIPTPLYAQAQAPNALLPYTLTPAHYETLIPHKRALSRFSETKDRSYAQQSKRKRTHHKPRDPGRSKKHEFAAYILQCIGVLCLILAALKAFEPLAGAGFTLVMMGFKGGKGMERKAETKKGSSKENSDEGGEVGKGVSIDVKTVLQAVRTLEDDGDWEMVERMD